jgi:hypothetical protein
MTPGSTLAPSLAQRRGGVLALTLAVHLLALFLWTQERRPIPHRLPQVVSILLQAHVDRPAQRARDRTDRPARSAAAPAATSSSAPPSGQRPDAAAMPAPSASDATTVSLAAPANDPIPAAAPAPPTATLPPGNAEATSPSTPPGGFEFGLAKRQAGRIDRELRKGKPGVPDEPDTPSARFQRGLESAHVDHTLTWQSDTYTSPDGIVIYRFRQGNRVRCRRAGSVGMPLGGMPDGPSATLPNAGSATETDCPKGVTWNRDDP